MHVRTNVIVLCFIAFDYEAAICMPILQNCFAIAPIMPYTCYINSWCMAMASATTIDKMLVPTNMNTDAHDANAMIE